MNTLDNNSKPREILAKLFPAWLQAFISYQTGVALPGQKLARRTPLGRALQSFALFFGGLGAGIAAAHAGQVVGLLVAWVITVAGARELHLLCVHHGAHGTLGSKRWSEFLGRAAATLAVEMAFPAYQERHWRHHRRSITSTFGDDTVRFLISIGLVPGLSVVENRRRFLRALVSPALIGRQLRSRVRGQLRGDRATRAAFLLYLAGLAGLASAFGWAEIALAWGVPVLILSYQAKAAMLSVEHLWRPAGSAGQDAPTDFYVRCLPLPPPAWTLRSAIWWGADALLNVLIRFSVLVGDLVNHPAHHGRPLSGEWQNHALEHEAWTAERNGRGLPALPEAWGYLAGLELALKSFESASDESLQERARPGGRRV